jgi:hypothetical protein
VVSRFLEDRRKPIADYDRIVFDEAEIVALRGRLDLETPLRVHWSWDYLHEIESLRKLYERGKTAQWNVETDIDWSVAIGPGERLMPAEDSPLGRILGLIGTDQATITACIYDEMEWSLSQLLHGEQAALQLCAQLVNTVPDMDTKIFAGQQVVDECRHVEMFAKLLARKFTHVHPIGANIKFLLDEMLASPNWHHKTIGMQVLFEGVAMAVITDIGNRTHNPLIRQVMKMVGRDEARHAAFGVLALRDELRELSQAEHDELEDWTWMCLEVVANGLLSGLIDEISPKYGLDPVPVSQSVFSNEGFWDGRYHMFNHTVLPNLRKLGIITDRTRSHYGKFRLWEPAAPYGGDPIPGAEFYAQ